MFWGKFKLTICVTHTILLWSVGAAVVGDTGGNTDDKNTDWNPITDFRYAIRKV